jgi:hypothetical protein
MPISPKEAAPPRLALEKGKLVAPGWQNMTGTLNPSGIQIDWSNGTYWERCDAARGNPNPGPLDLSGKWFPQGDLSEPCTILQSGNDLHIECAQLATTGGRIDGATHFAINWGVRSIGATVTPDRNHIRWDDQIYWTRSTLYDSLGK